MNEIEVIAEIGVNHGGDFATACKLVDVAKAVGADTVKTQVWNTERVYPRERWDEMKALELSRENIAMLKAYCESVRINFLCTPDDMEDALFLKELGVERIKIGSSNLTNVALLAEVGRWGLPILLSTGACTPAELDKAVGAIAVSVQLVLLHCLSAYPAPCDEQLNLRLLQNWGIYHEMTVGFSDHTIGPIGRDMALVALGLGARTFEKHLTLDKHAPGPDNKASLEPHEMQNYIRALRLGAVALGDGIKRIMPCEMENRKEYERFVAQQYANRT